MKQIVFATNNKNKLREINQIMKDKFEIIGLEEIGCNEEVPENQDTLEGNATEKSRYVSDKFQVNCFADDTGLDVESLDGAPGVYSARYAGEAKEAEANMAKLLKELDGAENRKARFRTVISLILDDKEFQFEGAVDGEIMLEKSGSKGFGYDPVFRPDGFDISFGEMDAKTKNEISHRGRAVAKLVDFLNTL